MSQLMRQHSHQRIIVAQQAHQFVVMMASCCDFGSEDALNHELVEKRHGTDANPPFNLLWQGAGNQAGGGWQ